MLVTTAIRHPLQIVPHGWLRDYLLMAEHNEYPWSFHLLAGMLTLGAIVGRRACVKRSTYELWPPVSVMLLGESGCGKSEALKLARFVMLEAQRSVPALVVGNDAASSSPRGWMVKWQRMQKERECHVLEGVEFCDEVSGLLKKRAGTETVDQWIIKALAHEDLEDNVGYIGHSCIERCTVAFGFGSPVGTLRNALDIEAFKGGLMHRFLFAHELDLDATREERVLDRGHVGLLAARALELRNDAPAEVKLTTKGEDALQVLKAKAKNERPPVRALGGFWRRYPGILIKIANLFAISEGVFTIDKEHVLRADLLVKRHLYPPLARLVLELAAGARRRVLFQAVEEVEAAGAAGLAFGEFLMCLDAETNARQTAMLEAALRMKLVWSDGKKLFAKEEWLNGNHETGLRHGRGEDSFSGDEAD